MNTLIERHTLVVALVGLAVAVGLAAISMRLGTLATVCGAS